MKEQSPGAYATRLALAIFFRIFGVFRGDFRLFMVIFVIRVPKLGKNSYFEKKNNLRIFFMPKNQFWA